MNSDNKKLQDAVHYICDKYSGNPSILGATKLNKILLFSDFNYYLKTGKSITNEKYIKRQFGPVPENIPAIIDRLKTENKITTRDIESIGIKKREFFSLVEPDLSLFTAPEISTIDFFCEEITRNHTAKSISNITHDRIWELAEIGEEIPYYCVFADSFAETTKEDIEWFDKEVEDFIKKKISLSTTN